MNKLKKKDEIVLKNWELLAEGKLEVEPQLLQHLKKFIPRREEYLKTLDSEEKNFMFVQPKPKEVWNYGRMSKILESYENAIDKLDEKEKIAANQILIDRKSDRDFVEDRVRFEAKDKGTLDDFKLGGIIGKEKEMTLKQLKGRLEKKGGDLSPVENVMIEKSEKKKTINERLSLLAGYNITRDINVVKKDSTSQRKSQWAEDYEEEKEEESPKSNLGTRKIKSITDDDRILTSGFSQKVNIQTNELKEDKPTIGRIQTNELKESNALHVQSIGSIPTIVNPAVQSQSYILTSEFDLTEEENKPSDGAQLKTTPVEKDSKPEEYTFSTERDLEDFKKEEDSIKDTFFWPEKHENNESTKEVAAATLNTQELLKKDYEYPEKIEIPKEKRGSGMTFRVSDCFYDDDGQFLYRVPGMVKTPVPEG